MAISESYAAIDNVLMPWAKARGIKVATRYRDDIVRSICFYDQRGNERAQIWLGTPDTSNTVTVFAAECRPDLAEKWGERLERRAVLADLRDVLEEVRAIALRWSGPEAFT